MPGCENDPVLGHGDGAVPVGEVQPEPAIPWFQDLPLFGDGLFGPGIELPDEDRASAVLFGQVIEPAAVGGPLGRAEKIVGFGDRDRFRTRSGISAGAMRMAARPSGPPASQAIHRPSGERLASWTMSRAGDKTILFSPVRRSIFSSSLGDAGLRTAPLPGKNPVTEQSSQTAAAPAAPGETTNVLIFLRRYPDRPGGSRRG